MVSSDMNDKAVLTAREELQEAHMRIEGLSYQLGTLQKQVRTACRGLNKATASSGIILSSCQSSNCFLRLMLLVNSCASDVMTGPSLCFSVLHCRMYFPGRIWPVCPYYSKCFSRICYYGALKKL